MKYIAKINVSSGNDSFVAGQEYDESQIPAGMDMNDFTPTEKEVEVEVEQPEEQPKPRRTRRVR